jgi:phosphatidylserine decarboxylase
MRLNMKNMRFADKMLFILGLTLSGVMAFVLVAGVIVALIKLYMDNKMDAVQIHSAPLLGDEPEAELIAAPFEQGKDDERPE